MNIQHHIATAIKSIAQKSNNTVNKPVKPSVPKPPAPPASFSVSNAQTGHLAYTRSGQLKNLGRIPSIQLKLSRQAIVYLQQQLPNDIASRILPLTTPKQLYMILFSLLQQSFKFFKDQLKRENPSRESLHKPHKEKNEDSEAEAEEQALELLDLLLEHADEAENRDAFCEWAKKSIETTRLEMQKQYNDKLPPTLTKSFDIMDDALLALKHGLSPAFIKQRLHEEIDAKLF